VLRCAARKRSGGSGLDAVSERRRRK